MTQMHTCSPTFSVFILAQSCGGFLLWRLAPVDLGLCWGRASCGSGVVSTAAHFLVAGKQTDRRGQGQESATSEGPRVWRTVYIYSTIPPITWNNSICTPKSWWRSSWYLEITKIVTEQSINAQWMVPKIIFNPILDRYHQTLEGR